MRSETVCRFTVAGRSLLALRLGAGVLRFAAFVVIGLAAVRFDGVVGAIMANNCGFCGGPGVTKEHMWSDWMRNLILESRAAGGQKHFQAEIERLGDLAQVAGATKAERLLQLWPISALQSWPPNTTIDDEALAVLDDRFVSVLRKN